VGIPSPVRPVGGRLALAGFAVVVVVSVLPWSRFGDSSRYFGAWTPHWSVIAALAGVIGLAFSLFVRRRPLDPRVEAAVYAFLGTVIVVAAVIQHRRPPILSEATFWPWVAVLGGSLAVLGAIRKTKAVLETRRGE
jgi:drug/metabolite transporter (DMT)-like permease